MDGVDDLIAMLDARIALLRDQLRALEAAIAALRGMPTPVVAPPHDSTAAPAATREGTAAPRAGPSKMPRHLCAKCGQRTAWDPCDRCGHAAPVIATLTTMAPDTRVQEDDD